MKNGDVELLSSEIFYKTVGDHGTMLPEKIRYTLPTQTGTLTPTTCVGYTYDESGNIKNITFTGNGNSMTYTYDKFNRLIREDDKELKRTMVYTYDGEGNITSKQQMVYQTETPAPGVNAITYTYTNGKMTAYNGLTCSYDAVGNPAVYKGQSVTWTKGRKLTSYKNATFTYDGHGRRISKNSTTYTYDSADRLIKTSDGLEFFYDQEGVAGFTYGGEKYCYQKDLQGNVIGIIDNTGQVVVQYKYDTWGMPRGTMTASTEYSTIASLNPFRYRGYIYDSETGFYYLQSRYYDPETCRFLNMDSVEYADPKILNGLNLYAYGLNNPVMHVDPTGHFLLEVLGITLAGVALVATVNDIYQLTRSDEENRVAAKRNGNSVEVSNSHKILTPWMKWGYGLYLNHVNDETKDVIQGTTSGLVGEWEAHNLAYYGLSALNAGLNLIDKSVPEIPKLMDRASPLNLEGTVFDNDEPIIKAGLVIYNVITRPVATLIDFLVHIGWL